MRTDMQVPPLLAPFAAALACDPWIPCLAALLMLGIPELTWHAPHELPAAREVKEDNHVAEAALGFPLHTDGPDRLGWLMNMNQVRRCGSGWGWNSSRGG